MAAKSELRKFRHDIATLKRRGLIDPGIDARSVTPNKKLNRALDKYEGVLSGKASAVKLSSKGLKEYKDLGKPFEIARPGKGLPQRVIIPHEAGGRVTVTHGKVRVKEPSGITRTVLPVKFHNLEEYLTKLRGTKEPLGKDEFLAFRFFGNKSLKVFKSPQALVDYLAQYESVFDSIEENDAEGQSEIYQNLEVLKIERPRVEEWKERVKKQSHYNKNAYRQRKRKRERGPEYKSTEYLRKQAERQAEFRARLKGKALTKYKAQGRKRAKKSAAKRKKK